jgi:uncharacterized membrane protein
MIDTLDISKRLLNAKDKKEYAEEIAHILKEREEFHFDKLATKEDITGLKTFITVGLSLLGILIAACALFIKAS